MYENFEVALLAETSTCAISSCGSFGLTRRCTGCAGSLDNLRDVELYLEENGYSRSGGLHQRLRQAYLVYLYAAGFGKPSELDMAGMKMALKEDMSYASRRIICLAPLGLGTLLVCGEAIAKPV